MNKIEAFSVTLLMVVTTIGVITQSTWALDVPEGIYSGKTSQGYDIQFEVTGSDIKDLSVAVYFSGSGYGTELFYDGTPLSTDGAFTLQYEWDTGWQEQTTITGSYDDGFSGTFSVRIDQDTATGTFWAKPQGTAPFTVDAGGIRTVNGQSSVVLDASGTSIPAGTTVSYQWTQTDGPTVSLSDANTAQASFRAPLAGTDDIFLAFLLTVTDENGKASWDSIIIHIQGVQPTDLNVDDDGDGYTENQGDCNDSDKDIFPGAEEILGDGIDQDCSRPDDWKTIAGSVRFKEDPLCAMVLANGQYMFTCKEGDDFGTYELDVPLDAVQLITIQAFVSGLAPFRQTTDGSDLDVDIDMQTAAPESRSTVVTTITSTDASIQSGWVQISGTVQYDGSPLCAMVLANGQYMFSCGANNGSYDLIVPLDSKGQITLYVFVSGFQPYKQVLGP